MRTQQLSALLSQNEAAAVDVLRSTYGTRQWKYVCTLICGRPPPGYQAGAHTFI